MAAWPSTSTLTDTQPGWKTWAVPANRPAHLVGWSDGGIVAAQELGKAYIERSPDGPEHLDVVFSKSVAMFTTEPTLTTTDIAQINQPVLVIVGDDDVVTLPHTLSLYEALPEGQLAVVPGASHGLPLEQPETVAGLISNFLAAAEPPRTFMPIRRARQTDS